MINHEMPRINKMVVDAVSEYAFNIFIEQIELDDGDGDEYDNDYREQDETNDDRTHYVDEDLPF